MSYHGHECLSSVQNVESLFRFLAYENLKYTPKSIIISNKNSIKCVTLIPRVIKEEHHHHDYHSKREADLRQSPNSHTYTRYYRSGGQGGDSPYYDDLVSCAHSNVGVQEVQSWESGVMLLRSSTCA